MNPLVPQESPARRTSWFQDRRPFFVRRYLEDFLELRQGFDAAYARWCQDPDPRGGTAPLWEWLEHGVGTEARRGTLWRLKDLGHRLWPPDLPGMERGGRMADWLTGSLFHEAMRLKEGIYLLRSYAPRASEALPTDARTVCRRLETAIPAQVDRLAGHMTRLTHMLRLMLPGLAGNPLVARLLLERAADLEALWGEDADSLFADAHDGTPAAGYRLAGESYLRGQWYSRALAAYQEALRLEPGDSEAMVRAGHIQAALRAGQALLA